MKVSNILISIIAFLAVICVGVLCRLIPPEVGVGIALGGVMLVLAFEVRYSRAVEALAEEAVKTDPPPAL